MNWKEMNTAPKLRQTVITLIDAFGIETEGFWQDRVWRDGIGRIIIKPVNWKHLHET